MEVNYFRFAVYMAWRQMERSSSSSSGGTNGKVMDMLENGIELQGNDDDDDVESIVDKNCTKSVSSSEMSFIMTPPRNNNTVENNDHYAEAQNDNDDSIIQIIDQGMTVVTQHQSDDDLSSSKHSAIGLLLQDVRSNLPSLHPTSPLRLKSRSSSIISVDNNPNNPNNTHSTALQNAYKTIHKSSLIAILTSLTIYTITATLISIYTRGLNDEVIAVIVGSSKFVASVIVFILSAKFPQWIGVYHEGAIRLAKCSSNLSIHFMTIDLSNTQSITKLRHHVLFGVSFHFAKFYILLLPFYCGVRPITIPFSILTGSITGLVLMWCIFLIHERNRNRRNFVAFIVIFLCSVMSALLFVRGMAWIQVIWNLTFMEDENAMLIVSFFGWLVLIMGVHALFVWHTLRVEKRYKKMEEEEGDDTELDNGNDTSDDENRFSPPTIEEGRGGEDGSNSQRSDNDDDNDARLQSSRTETSPPPMKPKSKMKRTGSYDSFLFDPRFQGDSFRGYKEPEKKVGISPSRSTGHFFIPDDNNSPSVIETPVVASSSAADLKSTNADEDEDPIDNTNASGEKRCCCKQRRRPDWCTIFTCFTPEYTKMPCFWKMISWTKAVVITISYLLCLYFVLVALFATPQIASTMEKLPAVRKALYETQNEGPVCAFDNRGAASNITTFDNGDAAHDAGFLVLHCGACGACSTWDNLIIEYTTRNNMAALANKCAMRGLFGGEDEITACIEEPAIGFTGQCALCWTEDIVCTKKHCSFIFLQSQITNSVGNFAVGPDDITSATCEEAHCEVGAFVPCVGATRRRMNIISSIPRPVEEQCRIVDVDWAELFAEYL